MPSPKHSVSILLLLLGFVFAVGNIWVVAARSTIPLALSAEITRREVRHEKHPPKDDVCLLHLNTGGTLHVDASVYEKINAGDVISKSRWSSTLIVNNDAKPLTWSSDFYGMIVAMPTILVVLFVTLFLARRGKRVFD